MERIDAAAEINCPIDHVFAYVIDAKNRPKWEPSILEIEQVSGGDGPGAKFRGTLQAMGQQLAWTGEITEYSPNENFAFYLESDMLLLEEYVAVDRVDGGTRLSLSYSLELNGIARMMAPLAVRNLGDQMESSLRRLKSILEAES